jgi:hypothetical protein
MADQRPRKRRKWRGIAQKSHFCSWSKSNDFISFTSRTKIFENMDITSEMAFTQSLLLQKGHLLSSKRAFIQEILFSFIKWGTSPQKKGHFFNFLKKWGEPHCPPPVPRPLWLTLDIFIVSDLQDWICIDPYLSESYRKTTLFQYFLYLVKCCVFFMQNVCNESIFIRYSQM